MILDRVSNLDELAFSHRNKAYGAYDLRRKYARRLFVSTILGIIILLLVIFGYWGYITFEPVPLVEGDMMYSVEYFDMSPPPDEATKLAQALTRIKEEEEVAPVVRDSVPPESEKPPEVAKEENKEDEHAKEDTVARPGGSGLGEGTGNESGIASILDVNPRYPGGDEARLYYLRQHIRYPEAAMKKEIQGVVIVVFIIEPDGSVTKVSVSKGIGGGCDEEAIRVTREMPRWEPGKRNGRAVRVMLRMPIIFSLPGHPARR